MKKIYEIVKQLENTGSTNDKINILKENKDNELLKKVLIYTYDGNKKFGISNKVLEKIICNKFIGESSYKDLFVFLDVLAANNINDNLRREISLYYNSLESEEKELLKRILLKDLRCNISVKSINKAISNLIHKHDVMLASKFDGTLNGVVAATTKLDGIRASFIIQNGYIKCLTRQGKEIEGLNDIKNQLSKIIKEDVFLDGELLAINYDNLSSDDLFRKTTKIVNSKDLNKKGLRFVAFDITNLKDYYESNNNESYSNRRSRLENIITSNKQELIDIVDLHLITENIECINELLNKVTSLGNEGLMLNYIDKNYEYKRTKNILKCKKFNVCDALILDVIEGDGKYKNKLGSILIEFEYEGKRYTCNVGTGFSDSDRELYFNNKDILIGKIAEISYFEISKNKNNNDLSMRFPTWKNRIRHDKKEISMN